MVGVIFPDGTYLQGDTWRSLEQQLRDDGWNVDMSKQDFRLEMANRAWNWSLYDMARPRSSRHLFEQMEAAGLLRMLEED